MKKVCYFQYYSPYLTKNETIRVLMSIFNGVIPNSPYTICEGVDIFMLNMYLKYFNCTLSITSRFPYAHISQPYSNIGLIVFFFFK